MCSKINFVFLFKQLPIYSTMFDILGKCKELYLKGAEEQPQK